MQRPRFRSRNVTLHDGREVRLRAVAATDARKIFQAFERLSKASRYARFMHHKKRLNPEVVQRSVRPRAGIEFVLVATACAAVGAPIVGAAQFVPASKDNTAECEFAITVADRWQRSGLATQLLASLVRRARHDGYASMVGQVLADNRSMLALARKLKFAAAPDAGDGRVVIVRRALQTAAHRG